MVDLHCHILPGIDDGAQDLPQALELLQSEQAGGVEAIAFTPHFNAERTTVEAFVEKRNAAFSLLCDAALGQKLPLRLKAGAEVFFSSNLLELDLEALCLQGTNYLLVEFSPAFYPTWAKDIFYQLQLQGIVPIVAHVERYPYMLSDPTRLYELAQAGALLQVNASSLLRGSSRPAFIQKLLRWNLVHLLSTDTHSMDKRPPLLPQAAAKVDQWQGAGASARLFENARAVFEGQEPDLPDPSRPKKFFGRWF